VAVGFLQHQLGQDITWLNWFIAAAPFSLVLSIGPYFIMILMMPPERDDIPDGLTAISSSTLTVVAVAFLFLPGIGVMDWKSANPKIPWGTIVLFGVGISLGTALLQTQAAPWLARIAVDWFGLSHLSPLAILAVMGAFLIVIHLGFASATALASAMIPIIIAVLQQVQTPGINVVGMTILLQFVVSFGFILPVNSPQAMVAYGTETFAARDFVRTGLALTVLAYALTLIFGVTYWRWLGYA
jgi:di/tricarboxylate transporter